jgi:ABC-2 type transport system ATP-binding protein
MSPQLLKPQITAGTAARPAIELRGITKKYGHVTVVEDVSVDVAAGQVLGLLGPNGAGKTTTIKMMTGLVTPTAGTVRLGGFDIGAQRSQAVQQIGAVLEGSRNVYWSLSAWQNLLNFGRLKGLRSAEIKPRAERLLRDLVLWDRRNERVAGFSRGMQQKVAVAAALVTDPPIVLLDEPTIGLDVEAARTVRHWVHRLAHDEGKTVVLTTHQLAMAEELADRVAVIRGGHIITDLPTGELLDRYAEDRLEIAVSGHSDAVAAHLAARRTLTAVGNETVKGLRHGWSERLQILIELPLFIAFLLLIGFTAGKATTIANTGQLDWSLDPRHMSWLLLGFVAFTYTYLHVQKMFWRLLAEIQSGTLEQTYLSPLPSWVHVVAGRIVAAIAESAFVVAVMYGVTAAFVRIDLHWRIDAITPLALLIVGAAGLAMAIAGLTLVWKRIPLLNDLALMLVMFFSGAILPVTDLPGWAETIGKPLFLTHTIAALRTVMLDDATIPISGPGGLVWMLSTSAASFLAGLCLFRISERIALQRGSLSHY